MIKLYEDTAFAVSSYFIWFIYYTIDNEGYSLSISNSHFNIRKEIRMNKDIKIESMEDALKIATGFKPGELVPVPTSSLTREGKSRSSIKLRSEYGTEESVIKNVFLPIATLDTMVTKAKTYLNSVKLKEGELIDE